MNEHQKLLLTEAQKRLVRVERRLIGLHGAIINATRNADRISLANDADSLRLDIDIVREQIAEILAQDTPEPTPRTTLPFGERLRRFRERASLSQEALAERADVTRQTINRLERGIYPRPYWQTVRKLAGPLGVSPDDLLPEEAYSR